MPFICIITLLLQDSKVLAILEVEIFIHPKKSSDIALIKDLRNLTTLPWGPLLDLALQVERGAQASDIPISEAGATSFSYQHTTNPLGGSLFVLTSYIFIPITQLE